jgi:hypothetical protein
VAALPRTFSWQRLSREKFILLLNPKTRISYINSRFCFSPNIIHFCWGGQIWLIATTEKNAKTGLSAVQNHPFDNI